MKYIINYENKKVKVKICLYGLELRFFTEQSFVMEVGAIIRLAQKYIRVLNPEAKLPEASEFFMWTNVFLLKNF